VVVEVEDLHHRAAVLVLLEVLEEELVPLH
jgi:hypothetical protein